MMPTNLFISTITRSCSYHYSQVFKKLYFYEQQQGAAEAVTITVCGTANDSYFLRGCDVVSGWEYRDFK